MKGEMTIGVIGGTGKLGGALARRWARAGHRVVIGSRTAASAQDAANEIGSGATGATNAAAAAQSDIVIVAVPFAAQQSTLADIAGHVAGKVVVDTTVPLVPPKVMRVQLPPEGCAALRAQVILGNEAKVVAAFHNIAAHKLAQDLDVECDVLVFGDDKDARETVVSLAQDAGLRALHAGALANSAAAEAMTSLLIFINKFYGVDGAGIVISGEPLAAAPRSRRQ
jgi:8-hydroxy-5-deazaflavin:NADPH oxidoreductase